MSPSIDINRPRPPTPQRSNTLPPMKPFLGHLSWPEVVAAVKEGRLDRFSRTKAVTLQYMAYIQTYTKQFNSMADCVKVDILGFPFYKADDGRIHAVPVEEHIQRTTKLWTLERNHFPYALEEGIEHWVIWTLGECEMPEDEMIHIFNNEFKGAEYIHLTNPPSLKTVPEIHHSHVFVNRTGRSYSPTAVNALLSSPLRQSAEPFEEDEE